MTRPFIACHMFDHVLVFTFETFESGTKYDLWIWKIFIMSADTPDQNLPNIHQSGQYDLRQGHSSNRQFQ